MSNAFRILSQSPVYFLLDGKTPAAGGRIEFYEAGTATPKAVYGDPALSVNNGSSIELGSDGRAVDDIWGGGAYRVRVYAADGTEISDDDNVEIPGGSGTAIPALEAGKVLSNDGAVLQWLQVQDVPDPTGQSGKIIGSDGANLIWVDKPADGAAGVSDTSSTATSFSVGGILVQTGSASAPTSGSSGTQVDVTFPVAFGSILGVFATITSGGYNSVGFYASPAVLNKSATGFTFGAQVSAHQGGSGHDANIIAAVPFDWIAIGTKAA